RIHDIFNWIRLLMFVVVVLKAALQATNKGIELTRSTRETDTVAAWVEKHNLGIRFVWIEWNSIAPAIEGVIGGKESLALIEACATGTRSFLRIRVRDGSQRCLVVAGALPTAVAPEQPSVSTVLHTTTSSALPVVRPADSRHIASCSFMGRLVSGDGVYHTADGTAAIQKCCGTFHNLQFIETQYVDRLGVISRLIAKRSNALPVLQDEDAIAIESADDGPAVSGAERAFCDPKFVVEHVAKRLRVLL